MGAAVVPRAGLQARGSSCRMKFVVGQDAASGFSSPPQHSGTISDPALLFSCISTEVSQAAGGGLSPPRFGSQRGAAPPA